MNHIERGPFRGGVEEGKEMISKKEEEESLVKVFEKRLMKPEGEISEIEPSVEMIAKKKKEEYLSTLGEKIKEYESFDPGDLFGEWKKKLHFHLYPYPDDLPLERLKRINTKVYKEVVDKYLDSRTHGISAIRDGLNEIQGIPENMIYTYFPMLKIAGGEIKETADKSKDVILENEEKLKILFGLYEKSLKKDEKETLKESEIYSRKAELERQLGFSGGDAIPLKVLKEYANTIKGGFMGCFEDWNKLIKECPALGPQPDNLTLFKTLGGVLNIIKKSLEELTDLDRVDKDDPKPAQLAFTIDHNVKTAAETINKILASGFKKVRKELPEIKIGEHIDDFKEALKKLGYKNVTYRSFEGGFEATREATEEEIKEIKAKEEEKEEEKRSKEGERRKKKEEEKQEKRREKKKKQKEKRNLN